MKKSDVIAKILNGKSSVPVLNEATAFAPTNIALCKYWGKRNTELNLPVTNSLSVSLADKGATVTFSVSGYDEVILNNEFIPETNKFFTRLQNYLNLFRNKNVFFKINITSNIPIAAGLASSASGFASIILALNKLFGWELSTRELSILARLGSGSASRSVESGFVEWEQGISDDGFDSYAEKLPCEWKELCVGLLILNSQEKIISSTDAMLRTVQTSEKYATWPSQVKNDLAEIKKALLIKDFNLLGKTAESNARAMHETMLNATPAIQYSTTETFQNMEKIRSLRNEGVELYFTQDAGPNLKLLFLQKDKDVVAKHFPSVEIIKPFS